MKVLLFMKVQNLPLVIVILIKMKLGLEFEGDKQDQKTLNQFLVTALQKNKQ